jgi:hypothetical protein
MFEGQLKMLQNMTPTQKQELINKFNSYSVLMMKCKKTGAPIEIIKKTPNTKALIKLLSDKRILKVEIIDKTK